MCKISVIVPVYNTEKYLRKCLDSLVNQTMNEIEIIVVNDGSIDNSEDIIKEYEKKYSEIKYLKKENGGLSDARNYGVKYATGEYIAFVDSDDYIDNNLFLKLEKYVNEGVDLIKYKTIKVFENGKKEKFNGPVFEITGGQEAFNKLYAKDILLEPAWLYLYRRKFWVDNKFEYKKNTYHEDFGLTPILMCKAQSVVSTNIYGYYYVQRENSIVTNKNNDYKKAIDLLTHYDDMVKQIDKSIFDKKTEENLKIYYTNVILLKVSELNSQDSKRYIKEIRKRKMTQNIKARNFKQLLKKIILLINIKLYLKLR